MPSPKFWPFGLGVVERFVWTVVAVRAAVVETVRYA